MGDVVAESSPRFPQWKMRNDKQLMTNPRLREALVVSHPIHPATWLDLETMMDAANHAMIGKRVERTFSPKELL